MGSKYTPEHLASIAADPIPLSQRLRGDYGIRSFDTTPIQHVAADALDAKDARIRELEEAGRVLGEEVGILRECQRHLCNPCHTKYGKKGLGYLFRINTDACHTAAKFIPTVRVP